MRYLRVLIFLLVLAGSAAAIEILDQDSARDEKGSALWNYASAHTGTYLLIDSKKYRISSDACYKRLFYPGASTIVDDALIINVPNGDCGI